nr:hypothetical protein [uncultured Caproiciproducens sp.]
MFKFGDKQKNKNKVKSDVDRMAVTLPSMNKSEIPSDVLGSYTGTARDGEKPDQDGDDL